MDLAMDAAETAAYLAEVYPVAAEKFTIEALAPLSAQVRLKVGPEDLRPGGTVSGPSLFMLADCAFYVATLAMIGRRALAVTTNCSIDFMRKPAAEADILADVSILKLGRVLVVGDVLMRSEGQEAPVARASVTYSIPPAG
ncbi:MAG: PaaI family thioesterase [Pseudomonadota bacterium]